MILNEHQELYFKREFSASKGLGLYGHVQDFGLGRDRKEFYGDDSLTGLTGQLRMSQTKFSGGDSCGETPVPIPNTEVKATTLKILGWRRHGKISTARFKKFLHGKLWRNFFA